MALSGLPEDEQERLEQEAVNLVVRLASGEVTEADAHAVEAWRRRGPAYERAYGKARRLWIGLEGLRDDLAGSNRALAVRPVPAASSALPPQSFPPRAGRRRWGAWGAMAAMVAALAVTAGLQLGVSTRIMADYATGIGERFTIALADGSRLQLNTRAAAAVHYTDTVRLVELLDGEAAFRVEKNPARPFIVQAQGGEVRAVGTEFLVQKTAAGTLVTVVEGTVEVRAAPDGQAEGSTVLVAAGQRVRYSRAAGIGAVESADLRLATAWQRGKLIFESTPLAAVVDEINRYRPGRVAVLSETLARHPVSGVFDLDQLDAAVAAIQQTLPVTTVRLTDRFVWFR